MTPDRGQRIGLHEVKLDQLNSEIVEKINASGRAYLTQTKLRGRTVMRIGLGNVLTTEDHLREAWEMIRETAKRYSRAAHEFKAAEHCVGAPSLCP